MQRPTLSRSYAVLVFATCVSLLGCRQRPQPRLDISLDAASNQPQVGSLVVADSRRYRVEAWLELRNGGGTGSRTPLKLAGVATIRDQAGTVVLAREFDKEIEFCVLKVDLFELDGGKLGGPGRYQLSVTLAPDPRMPAYYSTLDVKLKRVPYFVLFE